MNRQRVSDLITIDETRHWGKGHIITIKAGTGVGKSYYIKNILYLVAKEKGKKILFLIHRTNCTTQFVKEIQKANKSDVITIMTYQKIEALKLLYKKDFDFSIFDYIVCDEFHYFMSDSSFSISCDISLNMILAETNKTIVFMSATGDSMKKYINNIKKIETIDYEIDITYDFIKELKFFNEDEAIETYIKECITTGEKAIFFIQSATKAYELYKKYKDHCLFNCGKSDQHYKYVDKDKIDKMLEKERFEELFLITTTCMDAGVNINDIEVKHIICDVKDVGTLVQCIGRKRQKNNDDKIYLYIKTILNEQLGGMKSQLKLKKSKANFLRNHTVKEYIKEYPRQNDSNNIVYAEVVEEAEKGTFKVNELMYFKCTTDIAEMDIMIMLGKFGYCKYLANKFGFYDEENNSYNYDIEEESNTDLEVYLESIIGVSMPQVKDRKELIERIDVKSNGRLLKKMNNLNGALEERKISYRITEFKDSKMMDGIQKRYPNAWKVEKLVS